MKISKFQKIENFQRKNSDFEILKFSIFEILKIFDFSDFFQLFFFDRSKKYFFEEVEKKSGHQYRSKISLRIEWEHSQPLKTTLKYSSDRK